MFSLIAINIIIFMYVIPLLLINLNTLMVYMSNKRRDNEINKVSILLNTLLSITPVFNTIFVYLVSPIENREVFLITYLKGMNDAIHCDKCDLFSRRHQFKNNDPVKGNYGDYEFEAYNTCPQCSRQIVMRKRDYYSNRKLPFGKKVSWFVGIYKYLKLGLNTEERKLKELKSNHLDLEFQSRQLQLWSKLQESKLKELEKKMKLLKEEISNT